MVSAHRRLVTRRTVLTFFLSMVFGFNITSWLTVQPPDVTNDLIRRSTSNRFKGKNGDGLLIDCNPRQRHDPSDDDDNNNDDYDPNAKIDRVLSPLDELALARQREEARRKKSKELAAFYETIVESQNKENNGFDDVDYIDDDDDDDDLNPPPPPRPVSYTPHEQPDDSNVPPQCRFASGPMTSSSGGSDDVAGGKEKFLYVGVMTAGKYISTRCQAISDTWMSHITGKVEFYVGENANTHDDDNLLPIRRLATVDDDAYPPQKKSFLLLKTMYESYLNSGYQWFMRADDDIYIKGEELEKQLRKLNSSNPIFLGQTGIGNDQERGQLSLRDNENYCMGGPGMILSREALRLIGPHIHECVKELYTWHEDVEISRCVRRFAGINCPWTYEVQDLFYEHYAIRKGYIDAYDEAQNRRLGTALTMHPNKNPFYQRKLHQYVLSQRLHRLQSRAMHRTRESAWFAHKIGLELNMEQLTVGAEPNLRRFVPKNWREVIAWDFFTDRLLFSAPPSVPRRGTPSPQQHAFRKIVTKVMDTMNNNAKSSSGRRIEFKQIGYGYKRVNPLYGAEYVLDLLLVYKRKRGKKLNVPVRRHAYLQQTFTKPIIHEATELDVDALLSHTRLKAMRLSTFLHRSKNALLSLVNSNSEPSSAWRVFQSDEPKGKLNLARVSSNKINMSPYVFARNEAQVVNLIVPLIGRFSTFQTFMSNLETTSLSTGDAISLLVVLFRKEDPTLAKEAKLTEQLVQSYQNKYPNYDLKIISIEADFSRGAGLEIGASHFGNESLLFFCDVDVFFDTQFLRKCRSNTVRGKHIYYPILYSEFFPKFSWVKSEWRRKGNLTVGALAQELKEALKEEIKPRSNHFAVYQRAGYWRSYGFGLLCVYQDDFVRSGGFDTTIRGWGLEDVDLVDKFLASTNAPVPADEEGKAAVAAIHLSTRPRYGDNADKIQLMRAVDPSLIHVYHPSHCDRKLAENQFRMCSASRASTIAHLYDLGDAWMLSSYVKNVKKEELEEQERSKRRKNGGDDDYDEDTLR